MGTRGAGEGPKAAWKAGTAGMDEAAVAAAEEAAGAPSAPELEVEGKEHRASERSIDLCGAIGSGCLSAALAACAF